MWDERDARLNWRDDTGDAVAIAATPEPELDYVDRLMDAWASSRVPFNEFMANLPTHSLGAR